MRFLGSLALVVALGCNGAEDVPPPIVCPDHSGMAEGVSWTYGSTASADWTGQVVESVVTMREEVDALLIETTSVGDFTIAATDHHSETQAYYMCDADGFRLRSFRQVTDPTGPGTGTTVYEVRYDPPWLLVPHGLAAGGSWRSDMDLTISTTTHSGSPEAVSWSQEATAEEVETPAGAFEGIKVTTTTDSDTFFKTYAPGVGLVSTGDMHLLSSTR